MNGVSLMGTSIVAVVNTGDFHKKKNPDLIFSIYEKLSKGKGLLPPAIGFIFDSEKLSLKEKEDLMKKSNNKVIFLGRRMFENYLLKPKAILNVFENIPELNSFSISESQIIDWLEKNKWDKKYIDQKLTKEKKDEIWLEQVDGAKILASLFSDLTQQLLTFDKIKHSVSLCNWVIENSFEDLKDIQLILSSTLHSSK